MALTQEAIDKAIDISKKYGVSKLLLFGSALDDLSTANDLDLACEGINGWALITLAGEIENEINLNVDLVSLEDNNKFVKHIKKIGRVIYEQKRPN